MVCADRRVRAGAVLDDRIPAQHGWKFFGDQARREVRRAARGNPRRTRTGFDGKLCANAPGETAYGAHKTPPTSRWTRHIPAANRQTPSMCLQAAASIRSGRRTTSSAPIIDILNRLQMSTASMICCGRPAGSIGSTSERNFSSTSASRHRVLRQALRIRDDLAQLAAVLRITSIPAPLSTADHSLLSRRRISPCVRCEELRILQVIFG